LSNQNTPTPPTPEQQNQQIINQLSTQYKAPLRDIMGQAEEAVQTTISNMILQLVQMNDALVASNKDVIRLQKICTDNKLDFQPLLPNRAERRAQERKDKKSSPVIKK
jgi:hypothetical protein